MYSVFICQEATNYCQIDRRRGGGEDYSSTYFYDIGIYMYWKKVRQYIQKICDGTGTSGMSVACIAVELEQSLGTQLT